MTSMICLDDDADFEDGLIRMGKRNLEARWTRARSEAVARRFASTPRPHTANPRRILTPGRGYPALTCDEVERLYAEFSTLAHAHSSHLPHIDLETFKARIERQRAHIRRRLGTPRFEVSIDLVEQRPVVVIRPVFDPHG